MIEIFLNVERLSAGQMELRREDFPVSAVVDACLDARAPAGRTQADPHRAGAAGGRPDADRRPRTDGVRLLQSGHQRHQVLAPEHPGNGDRRTARRTACGSRCGTRASAWTRRRFKQIFQKFYRTRRAEQSGEAGTGIGLSIVEQIVVQHGGVDRSDQQPRRGLLLYPGVARQRAGGGRGAFLNGTVTGSGRRSGGPHDPRDGPGTGGLRGGRGLLHRPRPWSGWARTPTAS